jgi:hypothetical protein
MTFRLQSSAALAIAALAAISCNAADPGGCDARTELEAIYDSDQAGRGDVKAVPGLVAGLKQNLKDRANVRRLRRIVENGGWPRQSVVGDKAAGGAFLVIQHASLEVQKEYLPQMRSAVAQKEARPQDLALLEDRVLTREGRKQIYGSQLKGDGKGGWEFYPIEDEAHVDERRKAVGLPPLAEYATSFGITYEQVGALAVSADAGPLTGAPAVACTVAVEGESVAVPTEAAAIAIARTVWSKSKQFTAEQLAKQEPYRARLEKGVWAVSGSPPPGWRGGNPGAHICQKDGEVLGVFHWG